VGDLCVAAVSHVRRSPSASVPIWRRYTHILRPRPSGQTLNHAWLGDADAVYPDRHRDTGGRRGAGAGRGHLPRPDDRTEALHARPAPRNDFPPRPRLGRGAFRAHPRPRPALRPRRRFPPVVSPGTGAGEPARREFAPCGPVQVAADSARVWAGFSTGARPAAMASIDHGPGPITASSRNDQQNIAARSPPFCIGSSARSWCTVK
jgi:hypothetical protein